MNRLMPYLQLVRLPTVFTALADILLGFALTNGGIFELGLLSNGTAAIFSQEWFWELSWLLVTSACLYLSGMVFNDVFDRHVDAEHRPEAPIPSGRVSVRAATLLGASLMLAGLGASYLVGIHKLSGQFNPLIVASMLAVSILLYDAVLKRTPVAPLFMGGCRFLNVILGASTLSILWLVFARPQLLAGIGLGVFVVGLTWFARTEAVRSNRLHLSLATVLVNAGLAILIHLMSFWPGAAALEWKNIAFVLVVVGLIVDRRLVAAIIDPSPSKVQVGVKTMLMSLVVMDATLIYFNTKHIGFASIAVALLIPSLVLSRWIRVT